MSPLYIKDIKKKICRSLLACFPLKYLVSAMWWQCWSVLFCRKCQHVFLLQATFIWLLLCAMGKHNEHIIWSFVCLCCRNEELCKTFCSLARASKNVFSLLLLVKVNNSQKQKIPLDAIFMCPWLFQALYSSPRRKLCDMVKHQWSLVADSEDD